MTKKISKKSGTVKNGTLRGLSKIDLEILKQLYYNKEGLRAITLIKLLSSTRRTLYRHLNKLEKLGLISNIYPIWKVQALSKKWHTLLRSDNIQNHKFSFVIKLIRKPYWWNKRSNKLMKLKEFMFKNVNWGNSRYTQMERDDFLIQAFPNSIVIINRKKYWGSDAYDCFISAIEDTMELIRFLEEFYKIKLTMEGIPHMNIKSNHFVELKNVLANRCKEDKKGFMVEVNDQKRIWVDFSIPFGLEYGHKDHALDDYKRLNPFFTDLLQQDEIPPYSDMVKMIYNQQKTIMGLQNYVMNKDQGKPDYFG